MTSNAEILAQLGRLARDKKDGWTFEAALGKCIHEVDTDFTAILNAVKRLVKIEEAARDAHESLQKADVDISSVLDERSPYGDERRHFELTRDGMDYFEMARDALDAALKEPS